MGDTPLRELLVVGAGPAGLGVAIAAARAGLDYEVLEKGAVVHSIYRFPRGMTFFTTPELLELGNLPFVTPHAKPTREEALNYYRRVADTHRLPLPEGLPPGVYTLKAGLYEPGDVLRTLVLDPPTPDNRVDLGAITLP